MGGEATLGGVGHSGDEPAGTFGEAGIKRGGSGDRGRRPEWVSLQEELGLQVVPGPGPASPLQDNRWQPWLLFIASVTKLARKEGRNARAIQEF